MHSTIPSRDVSAQHLSIGWDGQRWRARDLASRNGTRLDGVLLRSGEDAPLKRGSVLELGSPQVRLVLVDDGPPAVIARRDGAVVEGDSDFLALPSPEDPVVVVLLDPDEGWLCATDDSRRPIEDGQTIDVDGQPWQLSLPDVLSSTEDIRAAPSPSEKLSLQLRVSSDEEYIEVTVRDAERAVALPPRAHHYLLLTLARLRLADADQPASEQGWAYRDLLRQQVGMSSNQFDVSVHRLRKEFRATDLSEGTQLIEQRKTTRQIRLGIASLDVAPL